MAHVHVLPRNRASVLPPFTCLVRTYNDAPGAETCMECQLGTTQLQVFLSESFIQWLREPARLNFCLIVPRLMTRSLGMHGLVHVKVLTAAVSASALQACHPCVLANTQVLV
eukprot:3665047-Amphidinium_carterae.2